MQGPCALGDAHRRSGCRAGCQESRPHGQQGHQAPGTQGAQEHCQALQIKPLKWQQWQRGREQEEGQWLHAILPGAASGERSFLYGAGCPASKHCPCCSARKVCPCIQKAVPLLLCRCVPPLCCSAGECCPCAALSVCAAPVLLCRRVLPLCCALLSTAPLALLRAAS